MSMSATYHWRDNYGVEVKRGTAEGFDAYAVINLGERAYGSDAVLSSLSIIVDHEDLRMIAKELQTYLLSEVDGEPEASEVTA